MFTLPLRTFSINTLTGLGQEQTAPLNMQSTWPLSGNTATFGALPENPPNSSLEKSSNFQWRRQARPQESFRVENWRILLWIFDKNSVGFHSIFRCGRRRNFQWGRWSWRFRQGSLLSYALFPDTQLTTKCNCKNSWFFSRALLPPFISWILRLL